MRKNGIPPESMLPFNESITTWEEYADVNAITPQIDEAAKQFLQEWKINHDWVFKSEHILKEKQERIMEALRYSPVGVSVFGWRENDSGFYWKYPNDNDQHWTSCVGYEKGQYWIIADSYEPYIKKLVWDYNFGFAKRYFIERLSAPAPMYPITLPPISSKVSFWNKIKQSLCAH